MRRNILNNKRGISPLIATVLLIAFAVALGAVVMNWGKNYVQKTAVGAQQSGQAKQKCTNTNLDFIVVSGIPKICYSGNLTNTQEIQFTLKNQASHELLGLQVSALVDADILETNMEDDGNYSAKFPLGANKIFVGKINVSSIGELEKVIFTPFIKIDGQKDPEPCTDNTLDVDADGIYQCS
jgi:flagellin-like protein